MSTPVRVQLLGLPLRLAERTRRHQETLLREFQLIELADESGDSSPPVRLLRLTAELRAAYDRLGFSSREFAIPRAERDDETADLQLLVPDDRGAAVEQLLEAMDEAEKWCESGELLTLVAPPGCRALRSWFLNEIVRQVAGEPPTAWKDSSSA